MLRKQVSPGFRFVELRGRCPLPASMCGNRHHAVEVTALVPGDTGVSAAAVLAGSNLEALRLQMGDRWTGSIRIWRVCAMGGTEPTDGPDLIVSFDGRTDIRLAANGAFTIGRDGSVERAHHARVDHVHEGAGRGGRRRSGRRCSSPRTSSGCCAAAGAASTRCCTRRSASRRR